MRTLADIATGLRLVIAAYIVYAGVQLGAESFAGVAAATLIGWTLDTVDGHLARAASDSQPSWLGAHDRYIDTVWSGWFHICDADRSRPGVGLCRLPAGVHAPGP